MEYPTDYLGDGVYARFDGFGIWLTTGDHRMGEAENKIYLEPHIYDALTRFDEKVRSFMAAVWAQQTLEDTCTKS